MHSNPLVLIHVLRALHGICDTFTRTHKPESRAVTELTLPLLICAMNLLTFLSYGQHESYRGWTLKWGREDRDLQKTEKNKSKLQKGTTKEKRFGSRSPLSSNRGPTNHPLTRIICLVNGTRSLEHAFRSRCASGLCCTHRVMKKHKPENYTTMTSGSSKPLKRAESLLHL